VTGKFWRRCTDRRAKWRGRHGAGSCCDKLQRADPPGVSCCTVRPASGRPPWPANSPTQRSGPGTDVVYESDLRVEESATCQPCTRRRLGHQRRAVRSRSTSSHLPVTADAVSGATTLRNHLINQIRWEHSRQQPHGHQIRQRPIRHHVDLASTSHPPAPHPCGPNLAALGPGSIRDRVGVSSRSACREGDAYLHGARRVHA